MVDAQRNSDEKQGRVQQWKVFVQFMRTGLDYTRMILQQQQRTGQHNTNAYSSHSDSSSLFIPYSLIAQKYT